MALRLLPLLMRQYQRNVLLLALLLVVPFVFITLSYYTTANVNIPIFLTEGDERVPSLVWMPDLHGAVMVPITAAFLSGMGGLFVMIESTRADGRLVVAGVSPVAVGATRLLMIVCFGLLVALLSVGVTLISFRPEDLGGFILANALIGSSYGLVGALVSLLAGRLGGAYLMLFIPMIDVGVFQDPMFISGDQPLWMKLLPGYGGTRLAIDAAFTERGDDWAALAVAAAWLAGLAGVTLMTFVRRASR